MSFLQTPLTGLRIIDLSSRLPGPLASWILQQLGAQVLKIEDESRPDAFLTDPLNEMNPIFQSWYQQINDAKEIKRFNFQKEEQRQIIRQLIAESSGFITTGLSREVLQSLHLTPAQFSQGSSPQVGLYLQASQQTSTPLHDLNAWALSGFLQFHVSTAKHAPDFLAPPFAPHGGICFAQQIATEFCAAYISALQKGVPVVANVSLLEAISHIYAPIFTPLLPLAQGDPKLKLPHNGTYPCYGLYRTQDGRYLALACLEEKYWRQFVQTFALPLSLQDRWSEDPRIFQIIIENIAKYSSQEILTKIDKQNFCLNLV